MSTQKRISALSEEQISYIKGCSILQCAVWRISHKDPLFALQIKISNYIFKEATLLLVNIREKRSKDILKRALEKWLKICKLFNKIAEKRKTLLKLLFIAKEMKLKEIKSKYFQRWKNSISVSETDILDKYGSIFKLLEYIKNASIKPTKKKFLANLRTYKNLDRLQKPAKKFLVFILKRNENL